MSTHDPAAIPTGAVSQSAAPLKKPRSPIERACVWGGIAILGCVALFEGYQKRSYQSTLSSIEQRFREQDTGNGEDYTIGDVRKLICGVPQEVQSPHGRRSLKCVDLKWPSLFKDYRMQLIVEREGNDPVVVAFTTPLGTDDSLDSEAIEVQPSVAQSNEPLTETERSRLRRRPRAPDLLALVAFSDVAVQLELRDEQRAALGELQTLSRREAQQLDANDWEGVQALRQKSEGDLRKLIDDWQFQRLQLLMWRDMGWDSLQRADMVSALELSAEQRGRLRMLFWEQQFSEPELRHAEPKQVTLWHTTWDDRIRTLLTLDQVTRWHELLKGSELAQSSPSESTSESLGQ